MFSQIIAVTGVNIRSIRARLGSSSVAVVGIAGVVLVFVAVLSIAEGVNAIRAHASRRKGPIRDSIPTAMTVRFHANSVNTAIGSAPISYVVQPVIDIFIVEIDCFSPGRLR